MQKELKFWLQVALVNLLILAFIGTVLRYKIAYYLPFVDQKHLLQGHSHFAFGGWVTQALMALMVEYLRSNGLEHAFKKYFLLLFSNLFTAYGMLVAFPIEGYGVLSIIFSTLSIFVAYVFAFVFWKDLNRITKNNTSKLWFKSAVIFNAISSIGAFSLAFMMANKIVHEKWYLSAVYFFLHFQYNGWFFFAIMGLFIAKLNSIGIQSKSLKTIFNLFLLALAPAYFLSVLWMKIPFWLYAFVVLASIFQIVGWMWLVKILLRNKKLFKENISRFGGVLLKLVAIAFSIKLLLQAGSTHPSLSQLAFGFRPIVIGYLHLVLLGVITLFILSFIVVNKYLVSTPLFLKGIVVFTIGIILNEALLMTQGLFGMQNISIDHINQYLLIAALILFSGVLLVVISQLKKVENTIYVQ